jgi:rubrerythrin
MHDHEHEHHHADQKLTDMDKLAHLLKHWNEHNDDHAANYRSWAEKAKDAGHADVAEMLEQAAQTTLGLNDLFKKAKTALEK